jgi:hypothetical protein
MDGTWARAFCALHAVVGVCASVTLWTRNCAPSRDNLRAAIVCAREWIRRAERATQKGCFHHRGFSCFVGFLWSLLAGKQRETEKRKYLWKLCARSRSLTRSLARLSVFSVCVCVLSVDAGVGFYVHIHPLSDITAKDNQEKPFEHFRSPLLRRQRIANLHPRPLCFLSFVPRCGGRKSRISPRVWEAWGIKSKIKYLRKQTELIDSQAENLLRKWKSNLSFFHTHESNIFDWINSVILLAKMPIFEKEREASLSCNWCILILHQAISAS